jgi:CrcB protein
LSNFIWVAFGGAIGASLRFFSSSLIKVVYPNFPLSTLFVNILGSFIIGYLMSYLENKNISKDFIRYFLIIGLLGSYTTFSTFSFDAVDLMNNRKFLLSFFYILISVSSCILFAFLGYNINKIQF